MTEESRYGLGCLGAVLLSLLAWAVILVVLGLLFNGDRLG